MTHDQPKQPEISDTTGRLYARAQMFFVEWCRSTGVTNPDHTDVARYISAVAKQRGPTSAPVHLSAVAELFRSQGRPLDTKSDAIQAALIPIRRAMRPASDDA